MAPYEEFDKNSCSGFPPEAPYRPELLCSSSMKVEAAGAVVDKAAPPSERKVEAATKSDCKDGKMLDDDCCGPQQ